MNDGEPLKVMCPVCLGALRQAGQGWRCDQCARGYPSVGRFPDLTTGERFEDDPAAEVCDNEARTGRFLAEAYLAPLLERLFGGRPPASIRVLSVGCGVGAEVEALNERGFESWGLDAGNRSRAWMQRRHPDRYVLGNALCLPFTRDSFDLVVLGCVIPHIGVVKDSYVTTPDFVEKRERAVLEVVRVTRAGGYVMLSSPNRLCPIDCFHRHGRLSHLPRLHKTSEPFLLSFGDYRRLMVDRALCEDIGLLPIRNYWGFFTSSSYCWGRLLQMPVRLYFDLLSWKPLKWMLRSPLNPWLVVLARK